MCLVSAMTQVVVVWCCSADISSSVIPTLLNSISAPHLLPIFDMASTGCFLFVQVNRKVIRDRLVIWALKGLFLEIILGAVLGNFRSYFPYFGMIFHIKALVSLESSGA